MATATVCLFFLACALLGADALHVIPRAAEDDNTTETPKSCTVAGSVEKCYKPEDRKYFGNTTLADLTDRDELDKRCKAYYSAENCMKSFFKACGNKAIIDGLTRGSNYVCGEGREALLSMTSCKKLAKVDGRIQKCLERAQRNAAPLVSTPGQEAKLCPILDSLRKCATRAVRNKCRNPAATEFVDTMYAVYHEPLKKAFGCLPDDKGPMGPSPMPTSEPPMERDIQLLEALMDELP